jgi:hypothetical protein
MRLSWNEIRARAAHFAEEWKTAHYERGESQTFYKEFFDVRWLPPHSRGVDQGNGHEQSAELENRWRHERHPDKKSGSSHTL